MGGPLYLNHAGTSWPKPAVVREAVGEVLSASPDRHPALLAEARDGVCARLGISDAGRFIFTPGCTAALAAAVGALRLGAGGVVLTSALEHHALVRPLDLLARAGVGVEVAPYTEEGVLDPEFVSRRLAAGGIELVAISAASNVTGQCLPVAEVAALSHQHGVPVLLDAAQTACVLPTPVADLGVDLFAFAGHKGPQGPQGIGGLWCAEGVSFDNPAASCAIGDDALPIEAANRPPDYCDVGGVNLGGALGLAAGLDWLAARGPDPFAAGRSARAALRAELLDRPGCRVLGGGGAHTTATSFQVDGLPVERAEAHFRRHGLVVRAGHHCADRALEALDAPEGSIRVSFGPEASPDDVGRVVAAVDAALPA